MKAIIKNGVANKDIQSCLISEVIQNKMETLFLLFNKDK